MMAEWFNRGSKGRPRVTPKDQYHYCVNVRVIDYTLQVLQEYGRAKEPAEGVVYWAGTQSGNYFIIDAAVAPKVNASRYGFLTDYISNGKFVEYICDHSLQYIAQVHSHPGQWVDHSDVDDQETAFRSEGLLSIVVPHYGNAKMPWDHCGVHRYINGKFQRLTNVYSKSHFSINKTNQTEIFLKDLRYE